MNFYNIVRFNVLSSSYNLVWFYKQQCFTYECVKTVTKTIITDTILNNFSSVVGLRTLMVLVLAGQHGCFTLISFKAKMTELEPALSIAMLNLVRLSAGSCTCRLWGSPVFFDYHAAPFSLINFLSRTILDLPISTLW